MSIPMGEEGFFQLKHRVYGREGEPCLVCKTSIKRIVIAGRSSHYCASARSRFRVPTANSQLPTENPRPKSFANRQFEIDNRH